MASLPVPPFHTWDLYAEPFKRPPPIPLPQKKKILRCE